MPRVDLPVHQDRVRVVLATTVLLSFISFWRAAAIVLNDLGSTAYYIGGISEQAIGKSAPWFVLGVMLFSYTVRAVYIESSAMFVRGGVYRVVKEAMGGTLAKLSVSALMFDYVLTGPISGVSAGQYIAGLINDILTRFGFTGQVPFDATAAFIALVITAYFWWRNIQGLHESSTDALRIMVITTVMVSLLVAWCSLTLLLHGGHLPPAPIPRNLHFSRDALGWLNGTRWSSFTVIAILVGFGHSILAMSGEESLAQVYREIEYPKVRNLKRTGLVIFVYSLLFTSLVSFFALAIIPDAVRPRYFDNLISGLAMHLAGPLWLRLLFQAFVVVVGFLILAGAVNTSLVGSNGVLSRVSEDGVLTPWFRRPHRRYGTNYRIINLVGLLQVITILLSRGQVYVLGEAYAFGVVWSFGFKALAMLVLRYTEPDHPHREWRVPMNIRIGGRTDLPLGLILISVVLFAAAIVNLFTKQAATISGVGFTLVFYSLFVASERATARGKSSAASHLDEFQLLPSPDVDAKLVGARPGNILVPVRDYNTLSHLDIVLAEVNLQDIVVMTVRLLSGPDAGMRDLEVESVFTDYEQLLFTKVVPLGESAKMSASEQVRLLGEAWERTSRDPHLQIRAVVYRTDGTRDVFHLGAHAPDLSPDDVELVHRLWLECVRASSPQVHHRDIVAVALRDFEARLEGSERESLLERMRIQTEAQGRRPA
jgi:amino acid transporter